MSAKYKIVFLDGALADLENIYANIVDTFASIKTANSTIEAIEKAILYIERDPCIYPISNRPEYRKCVVKNYVVIYRVDDNEKKARIVRIFHGSQDYENYL